MKSIFVWVAATVLAGSAMAKLPATSDEAKAKAAEAAAKTAHAGKVEAYLLCKSQDRVAAHTNKAAKPAAKDAKAATPASACVEPGAFVYTPAPPTAPAASAASAAVAAAPAAVADKPKK
jgi:hypothetical protein